MEEPNVTQATEVPEKSKATIIRYDCGQTIEDVLNYALIGMEDYDSDPEKLLLLSEYKEKKFKLTLTIEEL